jgi:hypothetical protein
MFGSRLTWSSDADIDAAGARSLADALKLNCSLMNLTLHGSYPVRSIPPPESDGNVATNIGDAGAQALAEALKVNRTLSVLSLDSTFVQHTW